MENVRVDVFPLTGTAFGFYTHWFEIFVPRMTQVAYALMVLFVVIYIGIATLKRFEDAELERKIWNLPVIIVITAFWPHLVLGLKGLVDTFNTFLVNQVFQMKWRGFGFTEISSLGDFMGWSAEGLARLLPNFAYWIIYSFFVVFFFLFAVLGPLILAKGILTDEIESFLELVMELTILYLWQTTIVILVAFIMPEIVSGERFPQQPAANFYFLSALLGLMILFTPSITRKFGNHMGTSFFPAGFRFGGLILAMSVLGRVGRVGASAAGAPVETWSNYWQAWRHRVLAAEEFYARSHQVHRIQELSRETELIQGELERAHRHQAMESETFHEGAEKEQEIKRGRLLDLSLRAKQEIQRARPQSEGD